MPNWMQKHFNEQAYILNKAMKDGQADIHAFCSKHSSFRRLCIIGSGSSFYCAQMMENYLRQHMDCEILCLLPSRIQQYVPKSDDLVLLITQEGKSVNVMQAADLLDTFKHPFSVLTALVDSPTAKRAESFLDIRCGEEKSGPKTKGVLTTLLSLVLLGIEMGLLRGTMNQEEYAKEMVELQRTIDQLPENIRLSHEWALQNERFFTTAHFIALLSVAPLCMLGNEAALKLEETLYLPSVSYEFEEFIHGPHCLINTELHIVAMYHGLEDEGRMRTMCAFAKEKGAKVLEISDEEEARDFAGLRLLKSEFPFAFLLPFQAVSAYLSEKMGHDLNHPKFQGFATHVGSKLY